MVIIKKGQLELDLNELAKLIQLDESRYKRMVSSYEAIKKWIEADEVFFKPYKYEVYPQGSVRIFTTVKPIGKEEFDLDIVIHFKNDMINHSPLRIYNELKRRLNEKETYKKMLILKSRVLRLNYAGDFHMDIMVGVQETIHDNNKILVPDRKLGGRVSSNPRGYADWFNIKSDLVVSPNIGQAVKVEKIQQDVFSSKKPLPRSVQLIKRACGIYFLENDEFKTRSIILTTIAGQFYQGEQTIFETIDNMLSQVDSNFQFPNRLKIYNPVNQEEDFTDKWDSHPEYYKAFKLFMTRFYKEWQRLKVCKSIDEQEVILKRLFGEKLIERFQAKSISMSEKSGSLIISAKGKRVESGLTAKSKGGSFGSK